MITGDDSGTAIEAGTGVTGNGTSGHLEVSDVDNASTTSLVSGAAHGTAAIDTAGNWTYAVNNNQAAVQALNVGDVLTDSFVVQSADGTQKTINITINGTNDAAVITGDDSGTSIEAGTGVTGNGTSGHLEVSDVDNASTTSLVSGAAHGTAAIDTAGNWTYAVNNNQAAVQALNVGDVLTDSFVVQSADGTQKTINITINGTNDAATFTGVDSANLVETNDILTAGGRLIVSDVDSSSAVVVQSNAAGSNGYGSFSINSSGVWSYQTNTAHNEFIAGHTYTDSLTVSSADGTQHVITVNITGANDAAVISGNTTVNLTESNSVLASNGVVTSSDVDGTANAFVSETVTGSAGGSLVMAADGHWNYSSVSVHNDLSAGVHAVDTFTIHAADGTAASLAFDITGTNDAAVITGNTSGSATEAGGLNNSTAGTMASGNLSATDVDGSAAFQVVTSGTAAHGTYSIAASGAWSYSVNNSDTAVQSLNANSTLSDSFVAQTADNTSQTVSISINGANDTATFAGALSGTVYEDLGTLNATTNGNLLYASKSSGTATVSDVDAGQSIFNAVTGALHGTYGDFNFTASTGAWSYTLDNSLAATNALNTNDTGHDKFTLSSKDGSTTTVDISVVGHTDHTFTASKNENTFTGFQAGDTINVTFGSNYKVVSETVGTNTVLLLENGAVNPTTGIASHNGDTVKITLSGYVDPVGINLMHDNYHIV